MNKEIIPAVIAKTQEELDDAVKKVDGLVDWIQIDIMDGNFVPNESIDFDFTLPETNCKFEAHLMVEDPIGWFEEHGDKVDTILAHFESLDDPEKIILQVKSAGKKFGFVINPETPVEKIVRYLDDLDEVLVMTVNPGFYGASFIPEALEKVRQLRDLKPKMDIEVDGGITDKTIKDAAEAGTNLFVSGSYILKAEDPKNSIETLKGMV